MLFQDSTQQLKKRRISRESCGAPIVIKTRYPSLSAYSAHPWQPTTMYPSGVTPQSVQRRNNVMNSVTPSRDYLLGSLSLWIVSVLAPLKT